MKHNKIIITLLLVITFCSCNHNKLGNNKIENLSIEPEFKNLSFENKFDFGYNDRKALDNLINEYADYLFQEQDEKDEKLLGFDITITENETIIKPLVSDDQSITAMGGCPGGYSNLGVCYSSKCVKGKIAAYFADNEGAFSNGSTISFKLVSHMGGKRVCGRIEDV